MKIGKYEIIQSKVETNLYKVMYKPTDDEMPLSTVLEEEQLEKLLSMSFFDGGRFTKMDDYNGDQDFGTIQYHLDYFDV